MSNTFKAGVTYKLDDDNLNFLKIVLKAEFSGEEGVFTVAALTENGAAFTDDITSPLIQARCEVPAFVAESCTIVEVTSDEQH